MTIVSQVITLKLIVVMSLNMHVMRSHDRMCVQCVQNGLQGNTDWAIIYSYTVEKSCIYVLCVRNDFHLTAVNTGAVNVESACVLSMHVCYDINFIQERNCLNVVFVANNLHSLEILLAAAEFTVERNCTNVTCVRRRFSQSAHLNTHIRVPHVRETIQVFSV